MHFSPTPLDLPPQVASIVEHLTKCDRQAFFCDCIPLFKVNGSSNFGSRQVRARLFNRSASSHSESELAGANRLWCRALRAADTVPRLRGIPEEDAKSGESSAEPPPLHSSCGNGG